MTSPKTASEQAVGACVLFSFRLLSDDGRVLRGAAGCPAGLITDLVDKAITAKTKVTSGSGGGDPSGISVPADGGSTTDPSGEQCRREYSTRSLGSEQREWVFREGGVSHQRYPGGGPAGTSYSRRWRVHSGWSVG